MVLESLNLGKAYRSYGSEWYRIFNWLGLRIPPREEHWVLRDVNFSISAGEAVGIVGPNGAGKSTLLKLITGTLYPTEGQVKFGGRIAAILELGMGFNPELTGRENATHAAGLMGFSHDQIQSAMNEIEAFAEIGEYFDQPIRTFSSGMQMRVAFAVATAWRPDLLIVDEALSVGDAYFQHKSFDRIRSFNREGSALLIVSHDKAAIQSICDRAILLDHGRVIRDGDPEAVFDHYNALLAQHQDQSITESTAADGRHQMSSGTGEATIDRIELYSESGVALDVVRVGQPIEVRLSVSVHKEIETLVLGCGIRDRLGQMMFGTNTFHTQQMLNHLKPGQKLIYTMRCTANLGEGSYSVHASLVDGEHHLNKNYHWVDRGLIFEVINMDKPFFVGCCWNDLTFSIDAETNE